MPRKPLSPAKVARNRRRAEAMTIADGVVKADVLVQKWTPWAVGLLGVGLALGLLAGFGERFGLGRTLVMGASVLAAVCVALAAALAYCLMWRWYKADKADGFRVWAKGSLKTRSNASRVRR